MEVRKTFAARHRTILLGMETMARPAEIDIVRLAYKLWEEAGKPEGRDQEFYLQALHQLQQSLDK
jgi:hypothetical protein